MTKKQCQNCSKTFTVYPEDFEFYKRMEVPAPVFCPDCRQQRRLSWSNEIVLYPRECSLCKKSVLSIYHPNSKIIPYCRECWWSDKWESGDYSQDINWNKNFFRQFNELCERVPRIAANTSGRLENCEYVHYCGDSKNCYLTFHADLNENCYYGYGVKKCKECLDAFNNFDCELCYQCIDSHECYNLKWSSDCINCYDSFFLKDCIGCRNCFGAVGLRNQEYYFFNQQLTKKDYEDKLKDIDLGSYKQVQKYFKKAQIFRQSKFYKYIQGHKNENSTGNNLFRNKNLKNSFDCDDVEKGKYCYQLYLGAKDCYDYYQFGMGAELIYEATIVGLNCYNLKFCHYCVDKCQNLEYCIECTSCKNCFGCASMKQKEFCIFNKQYSKKEYYKLIKKLKQKMIREGEYGEYFPARYSAFGYNETSANWWYPLKKQEAMSKEFKWQDNLPETKGQETIKNIPDNISEVNENLEKEVFTCEKCGKNYKFIEQEINYYKKQNLPLPRNCFYCRHLERRSLRNPRSLWHRSCDCTKPNHNHQGKCKNEFETTYSPERKELVYCEQCYNKEIY